MQDAFGVDRVSKGLPKGMLKLNPSKIADDAKAKYVFSRVRAHHFGREASRQAGPILAKQPKATLKNKRNTEFEQKLQNIDDVALKGEDAKYSAKEALSSMQRYRDRTPRQKAIQDKKWSMMRRGKIDYSRD